MKSGMSQDGQPIESDWPDLFSEETVLRAAPTEDLSQIVGAADAVDQLVDAKDDDRTAGAAMHGAGQDMTPAAPAGRDDGPETENDAATGRPRRTVRKPSRFRDFVCTSRRCCRW